MYEHRTQPDIVHDLGSVSGMASSLYRTWYRYQFRYFDALKSPARICDIFMISYRPETLS